MLYESDETFAELDEALSAEFGEVSSKACVAE